MKKRKKDKKPRGYTNNKRITKVDINRMKKEKEERKRKKKEKKNAEEEQETSD